MLKGFGVVPVLDWDKDSVLRMLQACDLRMPEEIVLIYGDTEVRVAIRKRKQESTDDESGDSCNCCPFCCDD